MSFTGHCDKIDGKKADKLMGDSKLTFGTDIDGGNATRPAAGGPREPQPPAQPPAQPAAPSGRPAASDAQELYRPGDIVDGYEIRAKLGEGGMGVVFLAYLRGRDSLVALKTFREAFLASAVAREAFRKEALLWVGLEDHACILAARWVAKLYGRLFVVMDYVAPDGLGRVTLQDHLVRPGTALPLEQTLRWAAQFCYGMEHAAAHGVNCHRDIKPQNILITAEGTMKISDFGLAAAAEAAWGETQPLLSGPHGGRLGCSLLATGGRRVCGTPGYIAPEVYERRPADVRSDIYSFGAVLWQMAAGSQFSPFHAPEVAYRGDDTRYLQEYQESVYQRQRAGRVPSVAGPLNEVIAQCLAYDRARRWEDFGDLRREVAVLYQRLVGYPMPVPELPEKTAEFWLRKGMSLHTLGRVEEAIDCCDEALQIEPWYIAWTSKGTLLGFLGRHEEALRCYDEALRIVPRYAVAWSAKGCSLSNLGRHEEALRCHEEALRIDPRDTAALGDKGISLEHLGRPEEALGCFAEALRIDPQFYLVWYHKAVAEELLGRRADAAQSYRTFIEVAPPRYAALVASAHRRLQELQ